MIGEKPKRKTVEWFVDCPHCGKPILKVNKKIVRKWRKAKSTIDAFTDDLLSDD